MSDEPLCEAWDGKIGLGSFPELKVANSTIIWNGDTWNSTTIQNITYEAPQTIISTTEGFNPSSHGVPEDGALLYKKPGDSGLYWYANGVETRLGNSIWPTSDAAFEIHNVEDSSKTAKMDLSYVNSGSSSYSFISDTNTGIYNIAADTLGFVTNGIVRLTLSATDIISTLPILNHIGSALAPAYSFVSDANTGIYNASTDTLGFATNGIARLIIDTISITSTLPIFNPDGTVTNPSISFHQIQTLGYITQAPIL